VVVKVTWLDVTVRPALPPSGWLRSIRAAGFAAGGRPTLYAHVLRAAVCSELSRSPRLAVGPLDAG
jgi:hypothetical protein